MRVETKQCLADVFSACDELLQFNQKGGDNEVIEGADQFGSRINALAIERLLEIIGEALSRIRQMEPTILDQITDSQAIIGLRNAISHGYDAISSETILSVLKNRIPTLRAEIEACLR